MSGITVEARFARASVTARFLAWYAEIAPTWYTASAEARARRERLQREAEAAVDADPFVQDMVRTFDAFVVPGSVRPIVS